jgi:hypothetical protein
MGTVRVSIGVGVGQWLEELQVNYPVVQSFEDSQFDAKSGPAFADFVDRGLRRHGSVQGYDDHGMGKVTSLPVLMYVNFAIKV